jgi:hypothetical protein
MPRGWTRFSFNDTVATTPGEVEVQWGVFYRCFPRSAAVIGASLLLPVGVAIAANCLPGGVAISNHPELVFPSLLLFAGAAQHPQFVREYFASYDLNPGIVVSHGPDLIAVRADLSMGFAPYPVVKLLPHPLKRMAGGRPPVGTRLATIAGYRRGKQEDRWADVAPVAVNCATADRMQIERALARIEARRWEALDTALREVPRPYRPGIYSVERSKPQS